MKLKTVILFFIALVIGALLALLLNQYPIFSWGHMPYMMGGYQGYSILWIGGFFLFILLVFGALLYVITKDIKKPKTDILEVRLAKGEINIDEYYEIKKLLRK